MRYNSIEIGSPCWKEKLSQISGVKPFRITLLEMRIFNESQKFLTKSHMFHYFHNVQNKCSIKSVIKLKLSTAADVPIRLTYSIKLTRLVIPKRMFFSLWLQSCPDDIIEGTILVISYILLAIILFLIP